MRWSDALAKAEKAGFRLVSVTGQTEGVVVDQNPKAPDKATKDSTIDVSVEILTRITCCDAGSTTGSDAESGTEPNGIDASGLVALD